MGSRYFLSHPDIFLAFTVYGEYGPLWWGSMSGVMAQGFGGLAPSFCHAIMHAGRCPFPNLKGRVERNRCSPASFYLIAHMRLASASMCGLMRAGTRLRAFRRVGLSGSANNSSAPWWMKNLDHERIAALASSMLVRPSSTSRNRSLGHVIPSSLAVASSNG